MEKSRSNYVQMGVAFFLMAVIVSAIGYVAYLAIFDYGETPTEQYLTPHTKDTTRILASSPSDVSTRVKQIMQQPSLQSQNQTSSVITILEGDRQMGIALSALSKWLDTTIDIVLPNAETSDNQPSITVDEGSIVFPADPIAAAAQADEYVTTNFAENLSNRIVIVQTGNEQFALLAGAWSSFSGDSLLFTHADSVPSATVERLEARQGEGQNNPVIYVIAPSGSISQPVIDQLSSYGQVRVPDLPSDIYAASVKFAQYRDFDTGFGWGLDKSNISKNSEAGYFNFIVVNPSNVEMGIAALPLAHSAKFGPVLFTDKDYINPVVDNYLWGTKSDFFITPAEGPFNHFWIVGDTSVLSYIVQSRFDYGTEIGAYRMQGAGMSSLEALFVGWIAFSIAGALYVGVSMGKSLKNTPLLQRLAWPLVVLMLGPFGLVAYWLSFSGRRMMEYKMPDGMTMMAMWQRPSWVQAMVATMTAVAFAASTMIATAWLLEFFFGLPLTVIGGPVYWLGNGMILTIAISYSAALLVSWLVFQGPMFAMQRMQPFRQVLRPALVAVIVSMTAVSLGMMTLMYFMHMWWLPMMPEDDDIAWMGSTFFATAVGAVLAMPPNYALVKKGIKVGEM